MRIHPPVRPSHPFSIVWTYDECVGGDGGVASRANDLEGVSRWFFKLGDCISERVPSLVMRR
jgi:hypothetical protein